MRSNHRLVALFIAILLGSLACATPVGVDRREPREVLREISATVLTDGRLSQQTDLVLGRLGLAGRYEEDPKAVINDIRTGLTNAPDRPDQTFALAELCFHHALGEDDPRYFLGAAIFAYAYLFPADPADRVGLLDPRLSVAAGLYNHGLAEGLRTSESDYLNLASRTLVFPFGELQLSVDEERLVWDSYRLVDFVPSVEYGVRGLRNRYRTQGIGAALVASLEPIEDEETPRGHKLPARTRVPITVVLRLGDVYAGLDSGQLNGVLELYVQDRSSAVQIGDLQVPLEYDATMALAYGLEGSPLWDFELAGFALGDLNPLGEAAPDGLFLLTPYHPGRVPVVLVHGTASGPARWAEIVNEILGDPTLNERVQLWFFIYPTGNPILLSAANLRDALRATISDLDPEGEDAGLQNMVVIGHSQGGLLTKALAVDSDTSFWENISDQPFEEVDLTEETRAMMERVAFFDALPFVKRVLFLATPHGGSYLSSMRLSNLAASIVTLPLAVGRMGVELIDQDEGRAAERKLRRMPTSIDNMRPGHPFLVKLRAKPLAVGTTAHSIIGVPEPGPPEGQNDGVVEFESARLEGVASEFHVRSGHSLQAHPDTINEVKRILRQHLDELGM